MSCNAEDCLVLISDVVLVSATCEPVPGSPDGCEKKLPPPEQIGEHLSPYKRTIKGCDIGACECIPIDDGNKGGWTQWVLRDAKDAKPLKIGDCTFRFLGVFLVSYKRFHGLCLDKPEAEARLKNPERPPDTRSNFVPRPREE